MPDKYLTISLPLQIMLASGYLGYLIAYAGMRQHHTATDAFFRTLAFGLFVTVAFALGLPISAVSLLFVAVIPLIVAAIWRWKGRLAFHNRLRKLNVKWADDIPTAWLSITTERTDLFVTYIAVDIEGGRVLICDDARLFSDAPFGPCKLGLDGSVAMYVTAEMRSDGTIIECKDGVLDANHGYRITYIPASAVKRTEIRYWNQAIGKAAAVEAQASGAAAACAAAPSPECKQADSPSGSPTAAGEAGV